MDLATAVIDTTVQNVLDHTAGRRGENVLVPADSP